MSKLKAIIVDDEVHARRILHNMLATGFPEVEVLRECAKVPEAVLEIKNLNPDLVFLDIEMPEFSGLDLFRFFDEVNFEVVFVTAYSEYAVNAFELSAVDYLLKPLQAEKLADAIRKTKEKLNGKSMHQRLKLLEQNMHADDFSRIALPVSDGVIFVELNEIVAVEADGAYSYVLLGNGSKVLVSRKIKFFEDFLSKRKNFFRIHRSHIVNLNFVSKYNRFESLITLIDNNIFAVSKERKKDFEKSFSEIRIASPVKS